MERDQVTVAQIIEGQPEEAEPVDPEFLQDFMVETKEHLENIETNVLELEQHPDNMEIIHSLFRSFHTIKGLAGFVNLDHVRELAHQTETLLDECRKGKLQVVKPVIDLILASTDFIKQLCEQIALNRDQDFIARIEKHLRQLAQKEWETTDSILDLPAISTKAEEVPSLSREVGAPIQVVNNPEEDMPSSQSIAVSSDFPLKPNSVGSAASGKEKFSTEAVSSVSFTRVPTLKIDNLVDMMGELIIMQSLIEQEVIKYYGSDDALTNKFGRLERITKDIQYLSFSLRMVSLKSTFQKINRIARDTISALGKNIHLIIEGEQTEIDRGVAENILEPLLHMVKNSISHGIEAKSERLSQGKAVYGTVKIRAYSKRGNVYIEISDDGRGLSADKIYRKALEKKLIDPSATFSDEEIIDFIFMPGFSTAETIDNISGRGVGLDVVKTEIFRNGGKIQIDNRPGQGCAFILKIPINLAAMNGTILKIAATQYIVPTLYIKQILQPEAKQWVSLTGKKRMIRIRDSIIPVIPIADLFDYHLETEAAEDLIIVLELDQKLKALPVQSIVGRREIVVKPLGDEFSQLKFISGASILGDGKVGLILDVENLFKLEGDL